MHLSPFLAALCLGIASAALQLNQSLDEQWSQNKDDKLYICLQDEEGWRREVWERNMHMIEQHNQEHSQGKHSFTMAMNGFGDMVSVVRIAEHFMFPLRKVFQAPLFAEIPSSVDWREKGYVTSVKEQGSCCSCWAFSATGGLEGQMFWKTGKLVSLSEQNLVDCSWPQGNKGCSGGLMDKAFQYVKENGGLDSEESYPYHARISGVPYHLSKLNASFSAVTWLLLDVIVLLECPTSELNSTFPGIYYDPKCTTKHPNHAVLVVGYGFKGEELDNKNYWIVKNRYKIHPGTDLLYTWKWYPGQRCHPSYSLAPYL
uniref:Procathepsin L n=1 Tax=Suricata suricatta TaxID=37032 RepID=A0A673TKA2_SURSU